jgi:hypothetical protein
MRRTEWALVAVGLLGFGLAALGTAGLRGLTGAGILLAGVACVCLFAFVQRAPRQ